MKPLQKDTEFISPLKEFWLDFKTHKGGYWGLIVILIIVVCAIFAPLLAPYHPHEQFRDAFLAPPFWQTGGSSRFILGTDDLGRDMLSRLLYGARLSMMIGVVAVSLSLSVGILLGVMAGYFRGGIDFVIMRLMDIMLAVPSLLLAIVIIAIMGPSLTNAMIAVSIATLPYYVRVSRSSVLTEISKEYVLGSTLAGASKWRQMFVNILPNCIAPLIVQASLGFSSAILDAAALGFLGLGAQPPTPEWGTMLASALQFIQRAWWVVTLPGLAILITVLSFNLLGNGLRDALDPKLKR